MRNHAFPAEAMFDLPAWFSGLADLQQGFAKTETVTDAHVGFDEARSLDVLPEGGGT